MKELTNTMIDLTKATGRMFEQDRLRMVSMVSAINLGGFWRQRRQ